MARTNNLTNFLTDVASAIKTKTGDSTAIPASQFDTKIADITTGHLDNAEYTEANDDLDDILEGTIITNVFPPDWSGIGYINTPAVILDDFDASKTLYNNWNNVADVSYTFQNKTLHFVPLVNTSNATNMTAMFRYCENLVEAPEFNTSNVINMESMFQGCTSLMYVPKFDTKKVTNMNYMFYGDLKLNDESLDNMLQMCIDAENYAFTKTLYAMGISNSSKYPKSRLQALPHYQDFIDAGWSIGY